MSGGLVAGITLALLGAFLVAPWIGRGLGTGPRLAFLLVLATGLIVALTLAPRPLSPATRPDLSCLLPAATLAFPGGVLALSDEILNVVLFVPLGMTVGYIQGRRQLQVLAMALSLPWVVESIQLALPWLGRTCQSSDLTANVLGLLFGVTLGAAMVRLIRLTE